MTNGRFDFFPAEAILAQVREALVRHHLDEIDYVTFVGQGEPTLCASLGQLICQVKELTDIPIAVITNGALFHRADVRQELSAADVVMPSLDAADEKTFRRVNRPWPRLHIAIAGPFHWLHTHPVSWSSIPSSLSFLTLLLAQLSALAALSG